MPRLLGQRFELAAVVVGEIARQAGTKGQGDAVRPTGRAELLQGCAQVLLVCCRVAAACELPERARAEHAVTPQLTALVGGIEQDSGAHAAHGV